MSESQERMMAIVAPEKLEAFLEVVNKWEVETSVLGEVTGDGRLVITWDGETIVDVDPRTVAHDGPRTLDMLYEPASVERLSILRDQIEIAQGRKPAGAH